MHIVITVNSANDVMQLIAVCIAVTNPYYFLISPPALEAIKGLCPADRHSF